MERREFIKSSCLTCATVIGMGTLASLLNACAPLAVLKTEAKEGMITVPASSFIEKQTQLLIRNSKMEYDILLVKKTDGFYNALYMQCSHENQPLTANKTGLFCSSHGSAFDLEGNVTQQPANKSLRKFKTLVENDQITIFLNS